MKVDVIPDVCQGHARCQDRCPEVFSTVKNCPEGALIIVSD